MDFSLWFPKNMGAGGVKERTESWGCPATAGLPLGFLKNRGDGWSEKAHRKLRVQTNSCICHVDFEKKWGRGGEEADRKLSVPTNSWTSTSISKKETGGGSDKAHRKLRMPTTSWISHFHFEKMRGRVRKLSVPNNPWTSHFDLQKKLGGGGDWKPTQKAEGAHQLQDLPPWFSKETSGPWKSTEKVEGAQQLLDLPLWSPKKTWRGSEKAHRKLRVLTNSWICQFDVRKIRRRVENAHRKLTVPTNSWICHFDFQKKLGRPWKSTEKVEGAHQLLDLPLWFRKKNLGGGVKSHTESWVCPPTPGFASSMCEKSGGGLKRQTKSWGCPPTLGFATLISKRNLGGREKAQKKLRVPTNSWICHFDLQK